MTKISELNLGAMTESGLCAMALMRLQQFWNGVFCELGGARERKRKLKTDIAQVERSSTMKTLFAGITMLAGSRSGPHQKQIIF